MFNFFFLFLVNSVCTQFIHCTVWEHESWVLALQVGVVIKQQNLQNHAVFGQLYEHNGYVVNNQKFSY